MAKLSISIVNRIGFAILGLTNNFPFVIMLSAAYDLLNQSAPSDTSTSAISSNSTTDTEYCKSHSTSTILLADVLPSLLTKAIYPILLVGINPSLKAAAVVLLSSISFITTGLTKDQLLIFVGVACASLSSGLGESTYVSNTPIYGEVSLSGWSIGTGLAGLLGSLAYAVLRMFLSVKAIMLLMLIAPVSMVIAYFCMITPVEYNDPQCKIHSSDKSGSATLDSPTHDSQEMNEQIRPFGDARQVRSYGGAEIMDRQSGVTDTGPQTNTSCQTPRGENNFDVYAKIRFLPELLKYFLPLLLVYYSEYFINQGLFELIYYPEVSFLDKASQYRWFQVSYQLGVMISRSSLELLQIKNIWAMSILQAGNAVLFLLHVAKLIYIPSFYLVIALIIYEGLLGGFTYVNAFYRIKKEVSPEKLEFSISAVLVGDSLGIVLAGLTALPAYNELCKLYQ